MAAARRVIMHREYGRSYWSGSEPPSSMPKRFPRWPVRLAAALLFVDIAIVVLVILALNVLGGGRGGSARNPAPTALTLEQRSWCMTDPVGAATVANELRARLPIVEPDATVAPTPTRFPPRPGRPTLGHPPGALVDRAGYVGELQRQNRAGRVALVSGGGLTLDLNTPRPEILELLVAGGLEVEFYAVRDFDAACRTAQTYHVMGTLF